MGVFTRFRRRSSAASAASAAAETGTAQTEASSPADDVEIPRQQSPEEAVDSDGGETPAQSSHTER
jgi:hypothetical protein